MVQKSSKEEIRYWRQRALAAEVSAKLVSPAILDSAREIEALRRRLEEIERSRSWKVTKPLRWAAERISSLRRRMSEPSNEDAVSTRLEIDQRIEILSQFSPAASRSAFAEIIASNSKSTS